MYCERVRVKAYVLREKLHEEHMWEENKSKGNESADLNALENVDACVFGVAAVEEIEDLHKSV